MTQMRSPEAGSSRPALPDPRDSHHGDDESDTSATSGHTRTSSGDGAENATDERAIISASSLDRVVGGPAEPPSVPVAPHADEECDSGIPGSRADDHPRTPRDPDLVADEDDWLAGIEVRNRLTDPGRFDRNARLWRRSRPAIASIVEDLNPAPSDIARSGRFQMMRNSFMLRLLYLSHVRHPRDWQICPKCGGDFTDKPGRIPCSRCDGGGYLLTHEGDPRDQLDG